MRVMHSGRLLAICLIVIFVGCGVSDESASEDLNPEMSDTAMADEARPHSAEMDNSEGSDLPQGTWMSEESPTDAQIGLVINGNKVHLIEMDPRGVRRPQYYDTWHIGTGSAVLDEMLEEEGLRELVLQVSVSSIEREGAGASQDAPGGSEFDDVPREVEARNPGDMMLRLHFDPDAMDRINLFVLGYPGEFAHLSVEDSVDLVRKE